MTFAALLFGLLIFGVCWTLWTIGYRAGKNKVPVPPLKVPVPPLKESRIIWGTSCFAEYRHARDYSQDWWVQKYDQEWQFSLCSETDVIELMRILDERADKWAAKKGDK